MSQSDTINKTVFQDFYKNELDHDEELLEKLLSLFEKQFNEFKETVALKDCEKVQAACHRLKSSCHSFGAQNLLTKLENLEKEVKEGVLNQSRVDETVAYYQRTLNELKKLTLELN